MLLVYLIWVNIRYDGECFVFCEGYGSILDWFSMSDGMKKKLEKTLHVYNLATLIVFSLNLGFSLGKSG